MRSDDELEKPRQGVGRTSRWEAATPLWQRVPTRADDGVLLADFMMLLPGLNRMTPRDQQQQLIELEAVLANFGRSVVFADLNLRLNLLWVSFKPTQRKCLDIAAAIQLCMPGALLVSSHVPR